MTSTCYSKGWEGSSKIIDTSASTVTYRSRIIDHPAPRIGAFPVFEFNRMNVSPLLLTNIGSRSVTERLQLGKSLRQEYNTSLECM